MSKRSYERPLIHSRIAPRPQAAHTLPADSTTGGHRRPHTGRRGAGRWCGVSHDPKRRNRPSERPISRISQDWNRGNIKSWVNPKSPILGVYGPHRASPHFEGVREGVKVRHSRTDFKKKYPRGVYFHGVFVMLHNKPCRRLTHNFRK